MEREADLYPPVKAYLQRLGYEVKGEVGAADVVALRGDDAPVIVELKLGFSLALFHQGVERLKVSDAVYLCVARPKGRRALRDNLGLCRRLGLGLMTVRDDGLLEVHADPGPYRPRKAAKKKERLLRAFERLDGDPNSGGATRHGIVTGYRQDALKCAAYLASAGAEKGAIIAKATGVPKATTIMRDNHYGWFHKVEKGVYDLTERGRTGLADWGDVVS
ncbi:MAG: DUF2161 family putative PD-(D/E)XK-type phosphodiesterase [Pseudomonadota bacterium]